MLVPLSGAPTWRLEFNENIWNSLLLRERLIFPRELIYIHINTSLNALTVETAKNHKKRSFFKRDSLSPRHLAVTYSKNLENSRCCILNTKDVTKLETCELVPSPGDDKNLAALASFDFSIL